MSRRHVSLVTECRCPAWAYEKVGDQPCSPARTWFARLRSLAVRGGRVQCCLVIGWRMHVKRCVSMKTDYPLDWPEDQTSRQRPGSGRRQPFARRTLARAWGCLCRPEVALFMLVLGAYGYFYQAGGWNQNSRFDLTRALVEQRTSR